MKRYTFIDLLTIAIYACCIGVIAGYLLKIIGG